MVWHLLTPNTKSFDFVRANPSKIAPTRAGSGPGTKNSCCGECRVMVVFPANFLAIGSGRGHSPAPWFRLNGMNGIFLSLFLFVCSVSALNSLASSPTESTSSGSTALRSPLVARGSAKLMLTCGLSSRVLSLTNPISSFKLRGGGGKKGKDDSELESDSDE